ncbi:hypothetical protein GPJ56_009291 [Histomonas meleagridis]|uniref:uncharacterized protein n=1 Tax=Histomonas meleagridis TaxID=135588 RepID=UPI0035599DD1|nr:hypothetical protein GPJ56_009291 [Histomonas meleagridis]KAH0797704.1 hypothetical protein GO595_009333 [Histomonas meleagridis]
MPPGSANAQMNGTKLSMEFPLPFITDYSGELFCVDLSKYKTPGFQLPNFDEEGVIFKKPMKFSITKFRDNFDGTQMLCHGSTSADRWCEALHIGFVNGHFVMQTKAHYLFPPSFLSLSSRAPPFDSPNDQLISEPIITNLDLHEVAVGSVSKDEAAFFASAGKYRHTSEDILYNFLVPTYQTIKSLSYKKFDKFRFFCRDMRELENNMILINSITKQPPREPDVSNTLTIIDYVILGLKKADDNCDNTRSAQEKYGHIYGFTYKNTKGFREEVLTHFGFDVNHNNSHPYIIYTEDDNMKVLNRDRILMYIKESCGFCDLKIIDIKSEKNLTNLIHEFSRANVIIGRFGVGLENALWMPKGGHMIEIRPIHFWCNDKYQVAAKIAGLQYHKVMNIGNILELIPKYDGIENQRKQDTCYSTESYCESDECYEFLRDQETSVEIETFGETWKMVLEDLKQNFSGLK